VLVNLTEKSNKGLNVALKSNQIIDLLGSKSQLFLKMPDYRALFSLIFYRLLELHPQAVELIDVLFFFLNEVLERDLTVQL
jgi:hypothetical protein